MNTNVTPNAESKALDAIHDVAVEVLLKTMPDDVRKQVELIVSIARYKVDMRG